jgi:YggT family protein
VNSVVLALDLLHGALRVLVFAAAVATAALAALSVSVRTRRLSPFGGPARAVRRISDPLFTPMERRVVRAGGQPAHAPWWTVAAVVVGGLVLLGAVGFVRDEIARATFALGAGPRGLAVLLLSWAFALLRLALLARVLGTWFGQGRFSPWTRWAYPLTDWFMVPLQRVVPTIGALDITPIVAYFGLGLLQSLVVRVVAGL